MQKVIRYFAKHVDLIYAAGTGELDWSYVLDVIAHDFEWFDGVLYTDNISDLTCVPLAAPGIEEADLLSYKEYYLGRDSWVNKLRSLPKRKFYDSNWIRNRDFLKTEIFYDWYRKYEIQYAAGAFLPISSTDLVIRVAFLKNKIQGAYTKIETDYLNLLLPHFERALALQTKFYRIGLMDSVEEQNGCLSLYVDSHLNVLNAQPDFNELLKTLPLLRITKGKLVSRDGHFYSWLKRGKFEKYAGKVAGSGCNYSVELFPKRTSSYDRLLNTILIRFTPVASDDLQQFGLTKSELHIAQSLLQGVSPKLIAQARSRSLQTVRTQIRSLLTKTNSKRMSELIGKLSS